MKRKESVQDFIKRKNIEFKGKNSLIAMRRLGGKGKFYWEREAWTFLPQSTYNEKVFLFERLRRRWISDKLGRKYIWKKIYKEYRIGYFIVGKIGWAKGKWVWGQFCPSIPPRDFEKLVQKAKKEKVII